MGQTANNSSYPYSKEVVTCRVCGRVSPAGGNFCGVCGQTLPGRNADVSSPAPSPAIRASEPPRSKGRPRKSSSMEKIRKIARRRWQRTRGPALLAHLEKGWNMIFAALIIFAFAPLLALNVRTFAMSVQPKFRPVQWGDLLTHISRQSGISLNETRRIVGKYLSPLPSSRAQVTAAMGQTVRRAFKNEGRDPEKIFRWLPPTGFILESNLAGKPVAGLPPFDDVPLDHPLYSLWKPLLDLDFPVLTTQLTDGKKFLAKPFEPVARKDWDFLLGACQLLRYPDRDLPRQERTNESVTWKEVREAVVSLAPDPSGPAGSDLRGGNETMVRATGRLPVETSGGPLPTRLEAIHLLAGIVQDLGKQP